MKGPRRPVVALGDLHHSQHLLSQYAVDRYAKYPSKHLPQVYEDEGMMFVDDGHHRVQAARQRGDESIRVLHRGDAGGLMQAIHRPENCPACGGTPEMRR